MDAKARPVEAAVARERGVHVDFGYLDSQSQGSGAAIAIELFDGMTVTVDPEAVETRGAGNYTFFGRIRGYPRSSAVLTVVDGYLAGHLALGETPGRGHGAAWRIQGAEGTHWLQEIDADRMPVDHPPGSENMRPPPGAKADRDLDPKADAGAAADTGDTIDLMVVYSNQTATAAGTAIGSQIQSAVDVANQSYARSNIATRLRLVHYAQVAYNESGDYNTELNRLTGTTDGYMDNVHTLRNTYAADLVAMFVESSAYCGMGWIGATSTYAFTVVNRSCAASNYSLAHELGHNFGARHDPYADNSTSPYAYGHGHVNVSGGWRTVMAYNNACAAAGVSCARIGYFSNPSVFYGAAPTGTSTTSDNARVHNATAYTIANFRTSGAAGCTYALSPASASVAAGGGSGSTGVSSATGCAWNARANASWLSIGTGSGTSASGSLYYTAAANPGAARSGTITVGDKTFTVSQASGCAYTITPGSVSVTASGITGTVGISTTSGCAWTTTSAASWVTVTSGASGTGNGTVAYSVAANTGAARASNLVVGDKTFSVTQAAASGTAATTLSTTALSFGNVQVGGTSSTLTAMFSNTGTVGLTISALTKAGSHPGDFAGTGTCVAGMSLQPGQSCSLGYAFRPTATGTRSATVSVTTAAGTRTLSLTGNGKPARGKK